MEKTFENAKAGPWTSPDGTIYPFGKPKGRAKVVKINVPLWELADVQAAAKKMGYDSMGLYIQEAERRFRRIKGVQNDAAKRIKEEMLSYGLTYTDLERA